MTCLCQHLRGPGPSQGRTPCCPPRLQGSGQPSSQADSHHPPSQALASCGLQVNALAPATGVLITASEIVCLWPLDCKNQHHARHLAGPHT